MADRKQTPDILGEVLGGEPEAPLPAPPPEPQPAAKPEAAPKRRAPARRSGQRRKAKPVRWEYLEILFRDYAGLRPRCANGEELAGWKELPVIHEYLNQLGEEGWELAGVGSRHKDQVPVYLKRHKG